MTTDQISIRIDRNTKAAAEGVFNKLGLSPTDAVRMFYRQVVMQRGLPFLARLPNNETVEAFAELNSGKGDKMSLKQFKALVAKDKE